MPSEKKRVGIYVRVSTTNMGQSTEQQETELKEYVQRRGWTMAGIYRDKVSGAKTTNRPGLNQLLTDCRQRKLDVVCVWALDRLARSLKDLLNVMDELGQLGVGFVCLKQEFDTTLAHGRLLFQVIGAVAEFERGLISQRVVAGLARAKREGKRIGRPPRRELAQRDKDRIRQERQNGETSIRSLARKFGTTEFMINRVLEGREVRC